MPRFVHFLYLVPLALGAVMSLKTFRQSWPRPYRLFALFLLATFVMELLAIAWKLWLHETAWWHFPQSNLWIYNLYYVPEYGCYFIFYYTALEKKVMAPSIFFVVGGIYLAGSLANLLFIQGIHQLDTYTIIGGNLGVLLFSLQYFKQELHRQRPGKVVQDPLFWISAGAFIFHLVSLPYFIFINYLSKTNLQLAIVLFNIVLVLNIFLYTLYLTAFVCNKPYPKKPI